MTKQNQDKPVASGLFRQPKHNADNPLVVIGTKAQQPAAPSQGRTLYCSKTQAAFYDEEAIIRLEQERDQARAQVADLLAALSHLKLEVHFAGKTDDMRWTPRMIASVQRADETIARAEEKPATTRTQLL